MGLIMKKIYIVTALALGLLLPVSMQAAIKLIGIGNYFQALRATPAEQPRITYSGRTITGQEVKDVIVPPVAYQGGLTVSNLILPVTIDVKFNQYRGGQPYRIIIEEVTDPNQRLACQGRARTVQASWATNVQKVCVPYTVTTLPTAQTGIRSGEFDNVALLLGPLGVNEKFNSQDATSLPFKFGLMAWTSINAPWNTPTVTQAYDTSGNRSVFSKPLRVLQGFSALGGGPIPRQYFGSILHIYNDTDYILNVSRSSTQSPELASYNITQVVPARSAMPYALAWIPKTDSKSLVYPGHDGIRATALMKAQTARPPDAISRSEIKDLNIPADVPIPDDFLDFLKMIESSETTKVSDDAAELLGVKSWDQELHSAYRDFEASNNFYTIATVEDTRKTHVQRCSVTDGACEQKSQELPTPAFGPTGIPGYYNLVAHLDQSGEFAVSLYPANLVAPQQTQI